jgi:hypothetical protein
MKREFTAEDAESAERRSEEEHVVSLFSSALSARSAVDILTR